MTMESEFRSRFWKSVKLWSKRFPNTKHPITLAVALFRVSWGLKGHPVKDNIVISKEWVMSQISQNLIALIVDTKMPLVVVCVITNMTCLFENKVENMYNILVIFVAWETLWITMHGKERHENAIKKNTVWCSTEKRAAYWWLEQYKSQ